MATSPKQELEAASPTVRSDSPGHVEVKVEVKKEPPSKTGVVSAFEDLIETVITTIQEPEVTDEGVAAVVSRLQAYSAGITGLVDSLPPEMPRANSNGMRDDDEDDNDDDEEDEEDQKPLLRGQ